MKHEPQEAYNLLNWLLEGEGNGGSPRTLESLQSKMKKLGQGKGEKGKEKEKKQEEEKDHAKQLAIVKAQLRSLLLEIPNPDGYDKVPTLLTAGDLRYREDRDQPPNVTKIMESWVGLPVRGRVNPGDREDPRAVKSGRCEASRESKNPAGILVKSGTMETRKGQAVQVTWTPIETEELQELKAMVGSSLSMGNLKRVLIKHEPQEAYALLNRLLEGEGNGGTPCTLESLQSKVKKLGQGKGERGKEMEKEKEKGRRRMGEADIQEGVGLPSGEAQGCPC